VWKTWLLEWVLWHVWWEHILWSVNILAEVVIINLSGISHVTVLSNHEVEDDFGVGHQIQILQNSQELGSGNVTALRPVVVLELGLQ